MEIIFVRLSSQVSPLFRWTNVNGTSEQNTLKQQHTHNVKMSKKKAARIAAGRSRDWKFIQGIDFCLKSHIIMVDRMTPDHARVS